jgi:hypothetical protein
VTLGFLAGTLGQLAALLVTGWVVSDVVLRFLRRPPTEETTFGLPERALAAVVGFVALSVVFMGAHVATRGAIFDNRAVVPAVVLLVVGAAVPRVTLPRGIPWIGIIVFVVVVGAVFVLPDLRAGPGARTGDPPWHLGWTEQLLHGEPVPTGPAPEHGRNAYPWGLHAVMATMTRLVPGTDPLTALEALHFLLVFALPLAAACLARRVRRDAGWAAAAAMALVGGWGWLSARGAAFVTTPTDARYGADLVVASPNSAYELLAPALPRELGLVLLGAFGLFLANALEARSGRWRIAAGATAGLVGLVSVPMFVSALTWMVAAIVIARRGEHLRTAWIVVAVSFGVFGLWLGPVAVDYVTYGGFVDITPQLGKEWALVTSLGSWGLLLPFAIAGVIVASKVSTGRVVLGFAAATALLLGFALARKTFEWTLAGNATLLHQGRVWPPAHLVAAALAGVAATAMFRRAWTRRRATAVAGAAVIACVGAASPVLASVRLTEIIEHHEDGFIYGRDDLAEGSFVRVVAGELSPDDVVAVRGSAALAFHLFEFSGCRLAVYDDPRLDGNDLRIRFAERAAAWDRAMASGGFHADYEVVPASDAETPRITGTFEGERWALVRTL